MPQLSKQQTKIVSLSFFVITSMIKIVCILMLSGLSECACIAGWHVNEELSNYLILIGISLIPDIIMLVSIGAGMAFEVTNIGADPGTIMYNFFVGILTISSFFSFVGVEDCTSDNLSTIKSTGMIAALAGVLHIANGVVCLLSLAPEETTEPVPQPSTSKGQKPSTSKGAKPSTSKAAKPSTSKAAKGSK